jgi:hypothetical protein
MKLYKVSRAGRIGYDEFDSMVVIAIDENDARTIHPYGYYLKDNAWYRMGIDYSTREIKESLYKDDTWVDGSEVEKLKVEYLGETEKERGVILASFNAG